MQWNLFQNTVGLVSQRGFKFKDLGAWFRRTWFCFFKSNEKLMLRINYTTFYSKWTYFLEITYTLESVQDCVFFFLYIWQLLHSGLFPITVNSLWSRMASAWQLYYSLSCYSYHFSLSCRLFLSLHSLAVGFQGKSVASLS